MRAGRDEGIVRDQHLVEILRDLVEVFRDQQQLAELGNFGIDAAIQFGLARVGHGLCCSTAVRGSCVKFSHLRDFLWLAGSGRSERRVALIAGCPSSHPSVTPNAECSSKWSVTINNRVARATPPEK